MVARYLGVVEAVGSNPATQTKDETAWEVIFQAVSFLYDPTFDHRSLRFICLIRSQQFHEQGVYADGLLDGPRFAERGRRCRRCPGDRLCPTSDLTSPSGRFFTTETKVWWGWAPRSPRAAFGSLACTRILPVGKRGGPVGQDIIPGPAGWQQQFQVRQQGPF